MRGSSLPASPTSVKWKAGATATAMWGVVANHGGGYQYRLCPKNKNLTEECFQQMPLEPATDTQFIAYGAIKIPGGPPTHNVTEIKGTYVNKGTKPAGSTWIRNPIPACYGPGGGAEMSDCDGPHLSLIVFTTGSLIFLTVLSHFSDGSLIFHRAAVPAADQRPLRIWPRSLHLRPPRPQLLASGVRVLARSLQF